MRTTSSILPLATMIMLTTACSKEELVSPANMSDPTPVAVAVNPILTSEEPSAMNTGGQQPTGLIANPVRTMDPPSNATGTGTLALPGKDALNILESAPDCGFPFAPGTLEHSANGSRGGGNPTPPIIPLLSY